MKRLMILTLGAMVAYAATAGAQTNPPPANPNAPAQVGPNFVDNDGDGICDRYQAGDRTRTGKGARRGGKGTGRGGYGPGDGSGNQGVGPRDGSGYGPGSGAGPGSGNCDGTGPKGQGRRGRRQ